MPNIPFPPEAPFWEVALLLRLLWPLTLSNFLCFFLYPWQFGGGLGSYFEECSSVVIFPMSPFSHRQPWVMGLGRKTTQVQYCFHHILPTAHASNMAFPCGRRPRSLAGVGCVRLPRCVVAHFSPFPQECSFQKEVTEHSP